MVCAHATTPMRLGLFIACAAGAIATQGLGSWYLQRNNNNAPTFGKSCVTMAKADLAFALPVLAAQKIYHDYY